MKTLIVDNYDSFTFNLVQMIAEINEEEPLVVRNDKLSWDEFQKLDCDNVIISPGPGRPENDRDFGICGRILRDSQLPILGVCLGLQGLAYSFGGKVVSAPEPVHGRTSPIFHTGDGILSDIPQGFQAVRYHSLMAGRPIPDALRITAWTEDEIVMGLEHRWRPIWAVQFHPESICTEYGGRLLTNFRRLSPNGGKRRSKVIAITAPPTREPEEKREWKTFSRKLEIFPATEGTFCSLFAEACPSFWLDTPNSDSTQTRFSFMGAARTAPGSWLTYSTTDRRLAWDSGTSFENEVKTRLFDFLQKELKSRRA